MAEPPGRERNVRRRTAEAPPSHLRVVEQVPGMVSLEEVALLYERAREVEQGGIVEVGSYRGRSTVALALGSMAGHRAPVFAIEPHEEFTGVLGGRFGPEDRGAFFRTMLETDCYRTVRLVNVSSEVVAPGWRQPVGLLWIDGDHRYGAVSNDFRCWQPHLTEQAVVIFDDSTTEELGPHRLVEELLSTGTFDELPGAGKVRVLRRADLQ